MDSGTRVNEGDALPELPFAPLVETHGLEGRNAGRWMALLSS